MKTLGIDTSTYTGLVWSDGIHHVSKLVNFPGKTGWPRLQSIAESVKEFIEDTKPELIVIEAYALGNKSSQVLVIECGTLVRREVHLSGIPWMEVPPTVLKKWTAGDGSATKDWMAAQVLKRWNFRNPSDDVIDAFALSQMGQLGAENLLQLKGVFRGK